jgi:hypothetical protein
MDGDENSSSHVVYGAMMKFLSIFIRIPASFKKEFEMKKIILLSLVVLLLLIPGTTSAYEVEPPTVTIAGDGLSFTITSNTLTGYFYPSVTYCDGTTEEFTRVYLDPQGGPTSQTIPVSKPISHVEVQYMVANGYENGYKVVASRNCEAGAEPLFMMWLLTRGDQGCILLSETHPSVERQKALCFPATDPDWVADNAPCADYVYDNDTWSCDAFGFPRLPLYDEDGPDLWEVWQRHAARQQE